MAARQVKMGDVVALCKCCGGNCANVIREDIRESDLGCPDLQWRDMNDGVTLN